MSIATKLASILEYKGDIKDAIERKGVTVGNAPLSEYSDKIDAISGADTDPAEWKDVNFIDYDGACILSYTAEEFLELTAMPAYPMTHSGLTFVEWNWTLSVAQNYVWKYKYLVVGASMTSSDGATRVTINIQDDSLLTVKLAFRQSKTNGVLIDWGDGSTAERFAGTDFTAVANRIPHTYAQKGRYTITYTPDTGCNFSPTYGGYGSPFGYCYGSSVINYANCIESIIYGNVFVTWTYLFATGASIESIAVHPNIYQPLSSAWLTGSKLKGLVIPKFSGATSRTINNPTNGCINLKAVSFPENATLLSANLCAFCERIKTATLPPNTNTNANWQNLFYYCFNLEHIVFPEGMTRIYNNTCTYCTSLKELIIPDTVTTIGQSATTGSAFNYCYALTKVRLSNNLTIIPISSFAWCVALPEIVIPEGVTTIGNTAFQYCQSLKKIVLPSTITAIGNQAFYQAYDQANQKLEEFYIKATTPPTAGTNILQNTGVPNFTIYVPTGSLSAYQSATNWSTYSARMQEYDFTRVECKFNVTSTSSATQILNSNALSSTTSIEVDGTTISPTTTYTFSSTGEHIVKYKFTDSTKVPASAFNGCSNLVDVEFPTNVVTIDGYSFSGTGLTKVTIPKWITTIQYSAFGYCSQLKTVVMESTTPPSMISAFENNASGRKFYVLKSCLSTYKETTRWSSYADDIVEMRYWGI